MSRIICRCCGRVVKKGGFQSHTLKHKIAFCAVIGRNISDAWKLNWENVVLYFNPKKANEKKCLHYDKRRDQKSLVQFGKKWK